VPPVDGSTLEGDSQSHHQLDDSQHTRSQLSNITADDILQRIKSCMNTGRIVKRIPLGSRTVAAEKLCQLLSRIVANPDDVRAWIEI